MEDLQVIIKMSELKEFEAKIEEAKAKDEQHKAALRELEELKEDLGGRKENVIRVNKHTTLRFEPSDRLAREVANSLTNDVFEKLEEVGRFSGRFVQTFAEELQPNALRSINFCLDSYGYKKEFSEEARLGVMDLEKGSQEAVEVMGAMVEKLKAELKAMESELEEVKAEYCRELSKASASRADLHALRLELARMQEENASLRATVQKLHPTEEKSESFLNKIVRGL